MVAAQSQATQRAARTSQRSDDKHLKSGVITSKAEEDSDAESRQLPQMQRVLHRGEGPSSSSPRLAVWTGNFALKQLQPAYSARVYIEESVVLQQKQHQGRQIRARARAYAGVGRLQPHFGRGARKLRRYCHPASSQLLGTTLAVSIRWREARAAAAGAGKTAIFLSFH
jgi:hypothetical protein